MIRFRPHWPTLAMMPLAAAVMTAHADNFVVQDIRLEGLVRLSAASVYALMPIAVGESAGDATSSDIVKALFASGQFEDVQVLRQGDALVVRLVERPSISGIELSGNQSIQRDDLLKGLRSIGLSEGEVFKRAALDQVKLELQRQYAAQGRYGATVTAVAKPLPRNRVAIAITIKEGDTARIKRISINGNKVFSDDLLLKQLQLQAHHFTSFISGDDKYSREKLTADIETLRSYYLDRGYLRFSVDSTQVSLSPDKSQVYIDVNVNEGEPYRVADVRMAGEFPVPEEELRPLLLTKPGEIYSQKQVTLSSEAVSERLGRDGYLLAEVQGVPDMDDASKTAKIIFYVNPSRVMTVRRINFAGNQKTDDMVLRREMRQFEGTVASGQKIDLSKVRLQRLGYFSDVKLAKERVPGTTDQVDLNYTVTEQPSGAISASVGYSQNAGIILGGSISQNNFLGTGNKVSVTLNRSEIRDNYSISFLDPYFTPDGISRGFSVYYRTTKFGSLNIANYATDTVGGNVTFSYPIDETETISFGAGADQTSINLGVTPSAAVFDFVNRHGSQIRTLNTTAAWTRNTLDKGVMPTYGGYQSLSAEIGVPGSDLDYYKLNFYGQRYRPASKSLVYRTWTHLGYGGSYGNGDGLPFYRNFFGGGFNSVRGFRDYSMGPRTAVIGTGERLPIGGNAQIEGGLELIFPAPFAEDNGKIRTVAFLDAGNVFDTRDTAYKPSLSDLRYSAGLGLSWLTPIGPLTFALSKPINKKPDDITQLFQFSIGQSF